MCLFTVKYNWYQVYHSIFQQKRRFAHRKWILEHYCFALQPAFSQSLGLRPITTPYISTITDSISNTPLTRFDKLNYTGLTGTQLSDVQLLLSRYTRWATFMCFSDVEFRSTRIATIFPSKLGIYLFNL